MLSLNLKKNGKISISLFYFQGLQELSELCIEAEEQEIKTILKLWPRMFCSLSTDPDHRVREATFAAHKQLAKRAGRNLAPVLKGLTGPWFVGQFDTFAPAASSAKAAFQVITPAAIIFNAFLISILRRRHSLVQNTKKRLSTVKVKSWLIYVKTC